MLSKFYVLISIIPGTACLLIVKLTGKKRLVMKFFAIHTVFFLLFVNMDLFLPKYDLMYILSKKQEDFKKVAEVYKASSVIKLEQLQPTFKSLLTLAPKGFLNTLFIPTIFNKNISSPLILMAALENLSIIFVLI